MNSSVGNIVIGSNANEGLSASYYDCPASWDSYSSYSTISDFFSSLTPILTGSTADFGETLDSAIAPMGMVDVNRLSDYGFRGFFSTPNATACRFHGEFADPSKDYFCVRASGTISISTEGTYSFGLAGDDNVVLSIDGTIVCSVRWGSEDSGTITLSTGIHDIDIAFCERSGGQGFFVQWQKPGDSTWSPLPQSILGGSN